MWRLSKLNRNTILKDNNAQREHLCDASLLLAWELRISNSQTTPCIFINKFWNIFWKLHKTNLHTHRMASYVAFIALPCIALHTVFFFSRLLKIETATKLKAMLHGLYAWRGIENIGASDLGKTFWQIK